MSKPVSETQNICEQWFDQAKKIKNAKELSKFVDRIMTEYNFDYGAVCKAVAACAVAAGYAADAYPSAGITGFQAGEVMWLFIRHWLHLEHPLGLIQYEHMLYPQYKYQFEKTIDQSTADWLKKEATRRLAEDSDHCATSVLEHWKFLSEGGLPFGYTIKEN